MTAGLRYRFDEKVAQFLGQLRQVASVQLAQVGRRRWPAAAEWSGLTWGRLLEFPVGDEAAKFGQTQAACAEGFRLSRASASSSPAKRRAPSRPSRLT